MIFQPHDALLIVDPQNDFFPGGALAVPEGDKIISVLNEWVTQFVKQKLPILVSRDWHPSDHCSFKAQGGIWPPHCIQHTQGAAFHPGLKQPDDIVVINKAVMPDKEAYSAFEGHLEKGGDLVNYLTEKNIQRLWVGGLATDYCVKATVLDAIKNGFEVHLIVSAIRGISEETTQKAIEAMRQHGVQFTFI